MLPGASASDPRPAPAALTASAESQISSTAPAGMTQLTTRPPPPKLIERGYGEGATRNGELVEREPEQLRRCPQPVQRPLLDGCHRRGRPVPVGRVRGEG